MNISPTVSVARFEQLEAGDLFIFEFRGVPMLAMKTGLPSNGDRNNAALLGPEFPEGLSEAYLMPWQSANVVSFGKDFTVLLPTEPAAWKFDGASRDPVCLAVSGEKTYISVNGGPSPQHFFQCFVEFGTGAIVKGPLQTSAAYTTSWEIGVAGLERAWRSIVKYPATSN